MIEIKFSTSIIAKLKELHLPVDQAGTILFVLFALYDEQYGLLDEFDDHNRERRMVVLYMYLNRIGLIDEADEDNAVHYVLTEEGKSLVEFVRGEVKNVNLESVEKVAVQEQEKVEDWIKSYIALFPAGRHHDRIYRESSAQCIDRMKWFINRYGYDRDVIMGATKQYVEGFGANFELMRNSAYFIKKNDKEKGLISDLLTACEQFVAKEDEPKKVNLSAI